MRKLISIIIPVYNVEKFLADCIDSVLLQSEENFEIILIDDGSTDSSPQMCDCYEKQFNIIKVIHKANGGLSSARNIGLEHAKGKYILFLDSDDKLEIGSLQKMLNEIMKYDLDVYGFSGKIVYQENEECLYQNIEDDLCDVPTTGLKLLRRATPLSTVPFYLIRKEFLVDNNLKFWNGIYYEDLDFTLHLFLLNPKIILTKKVYYIYNRRDGSITSSVNSKKINDMCRINERIYQEYENYSHEQKKAINKTLVSYIMLINERLDECNKSDIDQAMKFINCFKKKSLNLNLPLCIKIILRYSSFFYKLRNMRRCLLQTRKEDCDVYCNKE